MTTWTSYGVSQYVGGEKHIGIFPRNYKPGSGKVGVLLCRSAGQDAWLWRNYAAKPGAFGIADAIANAGFPCISFDCTTSDGWGNDTSISRVESARSFLVNTFGASPDRVLLFGQSMGGLNALAWAAANPTLAAGMAGIVPITNLQFNWQSTHTGGINTAYGGTYDPATMAATHDPTVMAQAGKYAGLPVQLWTASDDTIARAVDAQGLASSIGASAEHHDVGALGHTDPAAAAVDTDALVAFFEAAAA